jgi:hypothetical protein
MVAVKYTNELDLRAPKLEGCPVDNASPGLKLAFVPWKNGPGSSGPCPAKEKLIDEG